MTPLLVLPAAALCGIVLLAWFMHLESTDRRETIFGVILAVFLVEAVIYRDQTAVPNGLARIPFLSGELRPPEILLPLAAIARLAVGRAAHRPNRVAIAWAAFLVWYATGAVMGTLAGNPSGEVIYQAKAVMTLACAIFVVSGLRPERLVEGRLVGRWALVFGSIATLWLGMSLANRAYSLPLPGLPGATIGGLDVDAQLVLPVLGGIIVLLEACRPARRTPVVLVSIGMMLAPLASNQGAAHIGVGALVATIAIAAIGRTWSRRIAATATEALLLVAMLGGALILSTVLEPNNPPVDVASSISNTFGGEDNAYTVQVRERLWGDAFDRIRANPLLGEGLGIKQTVRRSSDPTLAINATAHNVFIDVALRTGIVGLLLFAFALGITVVDGVSVWQRHRSHLVAALALGAVAGIAAFVANSMVQSPLERFRNTTLLGILVGLVIACVRSMATSDVAEDDDEDDDEDVLGLA